MVSFKKMLGTCKKKKKIVVEVWGPGTHPYLYHVKCLSIYVISINVESFRNASPAYNEVLLYTLNKKIYK